MASTVTIDKAYFETILRRAAFHVSGDQFTKPLHLPMVTILKTDHDALCLAAEQYQKLRSALLRGGLDRDSLEVLVNNDFDDAQTEAAKTETARTVTASTTEDTTTSGGVPIDRTPTPIAPIVASDLIESQEPYQRPKSATTLSSSSAAWTQVSKLRAAIASGPSSPRCHSIGIPVEEPSKDEVAERSGSGSDTAQTEKQRKYEYRDCTILLTGLPGGTTVAEIVGVVRGGPLLDVFMRHHKTSAAISFVDGANAHNFLTHVSVNGIYIRGKRVFARWNDRQHRSNPYIARKIFEGATRNITIKNVHARGAVTDKVLEEQLDHIDGLRVVSITFKGKDVFISTTSVDKALVACSCLRSRIAYKGMKINFYPDECAGSFSEAALTPTKENQSPVRNAVWMNRFQPLALDAVEEEDLEEDGSETHGPATATIPNSIG
ncbi:MAG: hypothetical protein M1833_005573 [Piccolia ochrophora]|nr:MAG: hypothetical protein M1833_005573 [Piccolia ochrophora]